jgi:integrase
MARRRYQTGSLRKRVGKRSTTWIAKWREDEVQEGKIVRVHHHEVIGTIADYPTRKLAQRRLDEILARINSVDYRPTPNVTFGRFAEEWQTKVLTQMKPSTQLSVRSQLRTSLSFFNNFPLRDMRQSLLQGYIATLTCSPKSTRNAIATLRSIWNTAKAWGYVTHDPFNGLVLPARQAPEVRVFTEDEVIRILEAAEEPYRTFYWLVAETGMRAGELCGLTWGDIDIDNNIVRVRQSVWRGKRQTPKTARATRRFQISRCLGESIVRLSPGVLPNPLWHVFATSKGTAWLADIVVKRHLGPLLDRLGISRAGLHAFRHANASVMNAMGVDMKTQQARLGHSDPTITLGTYTHAVPELDKKAAEALGARLRPVLVPTIVRQSAANFAGVQTASA